MNLEVDNIGSAGRCWEEEEDTPVTVAVEAEAARSWWWVPAPPVRCQAQPSRQPTQSAGMPSLASLASG